MQLTPRLKILLIISCICLSFYLTFINYSIDQSIDAQYTTLVKLRNKPGIDSAESRKIFVQKRADINQQIDKLREKRHSRWYRFIAILLSSFAGWLIWGNTSSLFKKSSD